MIRFIGIITLILRAYYTEYTCRWSVARSAPHTRAAMLCTLGKGVVKSDLGVECG